MDKEEKGFFKTCFNTVAGLEVKNESQAIAKEVVLSEIKNLQQDKEKYRGFKIIDVQEYDRYELLSYKNYKDNWNELKKYIKTEIPEEVFIDTEWFVSILDKMLELEQRTR